MTTISGPKHAVLGPSSAHRWIQCPASIRMAEKVPRYEAGIHAMEGTIAHALGEIEASAAFGLITKRQRTIRYNKWLKEAEPYDFDLDDMATHIQAYVDLIAERKAVHPNSQVMLEQRVKTGIDNCWGTSDVIIVSPVHVEIIDLKYGRGNAVSAEDNPQLMLYGVGALEMYGDLLGDTEEVVTTIHQPRLYSVSSAILDPDELRAWRDSIAPIAAEALAGSDRFGPSESACMFCPAAGICRARIEAMTQEDFGRDPDIIDSDEMGELLTRLPDMKRFISQVEDTALRKMYSDQEDIPGWKVVLSGGRRQVSDQTAAIQKLLDTGLEIDEISDLKLKGIGALEKIIQPGGGGARIRLEDVLGDLVTKSPGKPAIAPEDDKRPAVDPSSEAGKEFT